MAEPAKQAGWFCLSGFLLVILQKWSTELVSQYCLIPVGTCFVPQNPKSPDSHVKKEMIKHKQVEESNLGDQGKPEELDVHQEKQS